MAVLHWRVFRDKYIRVFVIMESAMRHALSDAGSKSEHSMSFSDLHCRSKLESRLNAIICAACGTNHPVQIHIATCLLSTTPGASVYGVRVSFSENGPVLEKTPGKHFE
jgi:hypothetical protein